MSDGKIKLEDLNERLIKIDDKLGSVLKKMDAIKKEEEIIEAEEKYIEEQEEIIKEKEEQIMLTNEALLKRLGENMPQKFVNIGEWKQFVWDACRHRNSKMQNKTIDYWCGKVDNYCRFELCPLNR